MRPLESIAVPVRDRFAEWSRLQDAPRIRAGVTVEGWLGTAVLVLLIVAMACFAPVIRDVFKLPFGEAMAVVVPVFAFNFVGTIFVQRGSVSVTATGALLMVSASVTQALLACLSALSSGTGAAMFAALFIFAAAYQGQSFRASARYPFVVVPSVIAASAGVLLDHAPEHLAISAIAGPSAVALGLLLGSFALRSDDLQAEGESMRAALNAQMMSERSAEAQQLATALVEVLSHNHDIDNALGVARLNVDLLEAAAESFRGDAEADDARAMITDIRESLERVNGIFRIARQVGKASVESSSPIESVDAAAIGRTIVDATQKRFRDTELELIVEQKLDDTAPVRVRGGVITLQRIVENLIVNACEGNGIHAARKAVVRVGTEDDGTVSLSVSDDGPGFKTELLGRAIVGFETTKSAGTGLGLYTVERLVRASGGALTRSNGPSGGAVVTVKLARAVLA